MHHAYLSGICRFPSRYLLLFNVAAIFVLVNSMYCANCVMAMCSERCRSQTSFPVYMRDGLFIFHKAPFVLYADRCVKWIFLKENRNDLFANGGIRCLWYVAKVSFLHWPMQVWFFFLEPYPCNGICCAEHESNSDNKRIGYGESIFRLLRQSVNISCPLEVRTGTLVCLLSHAEFPMGSCSRYVSK